MAQWLERLTGRQKVAGLISVGGSEIVFLSVELDDRSSISSYIQALAISKSEIAIIGSNVWHSNFYVNINRCFDEFVNYRNQYLIVNDKTLIEKNYSFVYNDYSWELVLSRSTLI